MTFGGGTISGSADKLLQSRTLQTSGDVAWSAGKIVRPNALAPRGTVVVESGATLTASGGSGNRELDAHLQIDSGGKFLNTASTATFISHVVFHGPGGSLLNNGIVETAANTHLSIPGGTGNGTFIVRNNSVLSVLLNEADDFAFTGSIILDNGYFDAFVWNGGNLQFLLPSYLGGTGEILVDKLVNAREIAPGQSIGHLHLSGDYEQTQEGVLTIEIEGSNPNQVDRFSIAGDATLGGTLRVDAANLAPMPEATIEIVTAGSLSGTFDVIDWTGNEDLRTYYYPVYGQTSFSLSSERDGDMNHDGSILDSRDADLFVFALMNSSTQKWFGACPECNGNEVVFPQQHGDFNNNGFLDFDDIAGFQSRLAGSGAAANALNAAFDRYFASVPEPASVFLAICAILTGFANVRRRPMPLSPQWRQPPSDGAQS
jgi:hypothetical protein